MTPEVLDRASAAACAHLSAWLASRAARHLLLYAARPDELDVAALEGAAQRSGAATYYPRVGESGLEFRRAVRSDLVSGRYGILEPRAEAVPLDANESDVVIVVPGVAFDRTGNRLGSGLGFYDRALPTIPRARRIGVTTEALLLGRLPIDPWDVPVHLIATEIRLLDVEQNLGSRAGDLAWNT